MGGRKHQLVGAGQHSSRRKRRPAVLQTWAHMPDGHRTWQRTREPLLQFTAVGFFLMRFSLLGDGQCDTRWTHCMSGSVALADALCMKRLPSGFHCGATRRGVSQASAYESLLNRSRCPQMRAAFMLSPTQ